MDALKLVVAGHLTLSLIEDRVNLGFTMAGSLFPNRSHACLKQTGKSTSHHLLHHLAGDIGQAEIATRMVEC
jgi:hypothetical protein